MSLPIILRVFKGDHIVEVKQFQLDQIVIGNQAEVNLNLTDADVSPIHALIERRNDTFYLCDLGSSQGTLKNDRPVLDEVIESGENFFIGPFRIQFFMGAPRPKVVAPDVISTEKLETTLSQIRPDEVKVKIEDSAPELPVAMPALTSMSEVPSPIEKAAVSETSPVPDLVSTLAPISQPEKNSTVDKRPDLAKRALVPPAAIQEENKVIRGSKGSVLEVSVSWKERIIDTYHFRGEKAVTIGSGEKADIQLPRGIFRGQHVIVDFVAGVAAVNFKSEMTGDLLLEMHTRDFNYLKEKGRLSSNTRGHSVLRLEQGEAIKVCLVPGIINIYIRYVPSTQKPALMPYLPFTVGEIASLVAATALVGLLAFYNAIHAPLEKPEEKIEPEIVSVTKFVYPTVKPPPEKKPEVKPPEPVVVKPPEPPKKQKVVLGEKTESGKNGTTGVGAKSTAGNAGSRAAEAMPNANKNAPKKFTSVNQGGAVKLGAQAGANANQAKKDVDLNDVGLISAFGGGGARSKLTQAVHGAGGIIGDSNKATGSVGFSKDRPGDDLGSAFKADGAGGKGVATEGIAGGVTNGRGSGNAGYGGVGSGLGDKGGVSINVGGQGESIIGTIDRNGIRRVILSKQAVIRRCYEKELRFKKALGGRVMLVFEINEKGSVNSAKVESSELGDSSVGNCLRDELVTWQFPEAPAGSVAEIHYPFNFQPKE